MHIESLKLEHFRSVDQGAVTFHRDLTVLVGENNGGKSNIVDALRLLTHPVSGRRDRWAEESDIRAGSGSAFSLEGRFAGLSPTQQGVLVSALAGPRSDEAIVGFTFDMTKQRGRVRVWAGQFKGEPEHGSLDLIRHVYLPPLRDAQRELASSNPARIAALLRHFLAKDGEEGFVSALARPADHQVLADVNTTVSKLLGDLTSGARGQSAKLGFASERLYDVARDLRFRLADAGVDPEELTSSGLGYANLLFMTTVMVELEKAREADLTLVLVEEPEAHLHPQLQMLVLDFLREAAENSRNRPVKPGQPQGAIQVIVTSHSPNLTAWVAPKHLVVVRSVGTGEAGRRASRCVAVASLGLPSKQLAKVSRYLDVTRSAMLFGGRVMLVEGIAEALLIPVIAKVHVLREDRAGWKRFQGATLVAIDGVDFVPYVEVLLTAHGETRIADRVVVVTDRDPKLPSNRGETLRRLGETLGASDALHVKTNEKTLEWDLFVAGNEAILKAAYLDLHPLSETKWDFAMCDKSTSDRADAFLDLLEDVRKGDLAQRLADRIEAGERFEVPCYLCESIRALVDA